jgi:alpha-ribazole phosphatase
MHVYLIRHPKPIDADGLCYGRLDVAVTPQATAAAAAEVSAQISAEVLNGARIYCSPSARCLDLGRRIASPREPTPADDLMEMNFGQWQGLAWNTVPRAEIDAWANDVWGYEPGGGESARMVAARWQRWLDRLPRIDGGSIVAVTHAGVIRVALARSGRLGRACALEAAVPFGSVHRLDVV